jgi:hypothetical protein
MNRCRVLLRQPQLLQDPTVDVCLVQDRAACRHLHNVRIGVLEVLPLADGLDGSACKQRNRARERLALNYRRFGLRRTISNGTRRRMVWPRYMAGPV